MLTLAPVLVLGLVAPSWAPRYEVVPIETPIVDGADVSRDSDPLANSVVLEHGVTIRFESERPADGYTHETKHVIKVLTPGGRVVADNYVNLDHNSYLVSVGGRTSLGSEVMGQLPQKSVAFFSASADAGVLYNDSRLARFRVPSVAVGHVVETHTKTRVERGYYLPPHYFNSSRPVRDSWIRVEAPANWKIGASYSEEGRIASFEYMSAPASRAGWVVHTWRKKHLDGYRREPLDLTFGMRAKRLRLSILSAPTKADTFERWEDVGDWYRQLVGDRARVPPLALNALKKREAAVKNATRDPLVPLFRFVRDRIRYVAIHEGIGAYQPHDANDVLTKRYGDCKDMATLLVGLYADAGVRAYPVLIGTNDLGVFDKALPSVSSFNHAIVAIPKDGGGYHFADPTRKSGRFGHLSWNLQGRYALVIKPDGVDLVETTVGAPKDSESETTWTVERDGTTKLRVVLRGAAGRWFERRHVEKSEDLRKLALRYAYRIRDKSLKDAKVAFDDTEQVVTLEATFELEKEPSVLPMSWFIDSSPEYRVTEDRHSAVNLGMPFLSRVIIDAEIGSTPLVWAPRARQETHEAFRYEVVSTQRDGRVRIERTFEVSKSLMAPNTLPNVRALGEALKDTALDAIVFSKKGGI